MGNKVEVHIRARNCEDESVWVCDKGSLEYIRCGKRVKIEGFYSIYLAESTEQIYRERVQAHVKLFCEGQNGAVFAYGQTGSGKTYTMFGQNKDGFVYLALKDMLPGAVSVSYFQIHNERIYDMATGHELGLFVESSEIHISGLHSERVVTEEEAHEFLQRCDPNRRICSTEKNNQSSRSHAIIQMRNSTASFYFIDLAGSEKSSGSEAQKQEGAYINRSLLALGRVVRNMGKGRYMGFRESKLTRILQPIMDGTTHLVAFCMFSTHVSCLEESLSTLNFAAQLSNVELKKTETLSPHPSTSSTSSDISKHENIGVAENDLEDLESIKRSTRIMRERLYLYHKRIEMLEKMIRDLLWRSPNRLMSDIFVLEKQKFNIETTEKLSKECIQNASEEF